MKYELNLDNLRTANVNRCEEVFHPINEWSPSDWACAFAGEAGEACNEVKKLRRLDGTDDADAKEARIANISDELADAIIYADLLAARLGIDLSAAIQRKFNAVTEITRSTWYL